MLDTGPVRLWTVGDILWAENEVMTAAYVASDDPRKLGTVGWYGEGGDAIWVEYVSREHAKAWESPTPGQAVQDPR